MPLTPFHLGPALLLWVPFRRRLDLPTLLVASVVVDVRAALVLFGPLGPPVHGILTTFAGGTAVAIALAAAVVALSGYLEPVRARTRLPDSVGVGPVLAGALVGVYSHVVLDATLYADASPLYPLDGNPFYVGPAASLPVYAGCLLAGVLALSLIAIQRRHSAA